MSLEKQSAVFRQKQWKVTIWYVDFSKAKEQSSISHQPITFNPIPRGETENWKLKSFQAEHFRLESCWNIWFVRSKKYLISYPTWALIRSEPGYRNKELVGLLPLALIRSRLVFRIQVGSECDKKIYWFKISFGEIKKIVPKILLHMTTKLTQLFCLQAGRYEKKQTL